MAELRIQVPGEPPRTVRLEGRALVLGRADDADVQLVDKRASKRHLRVEPVVGADGATVWVAADLQSSNGTVFGETRLLRRVLEDGDVLRIGDATVTYLAPAGARAPAAAGGPAAVVLSGALVEEATVATAPAPVAEEAAAEGEDEAAPERTGMDPGAVRAAVAGRRVIGRGALVLGAAVAVLVGVEVFVSRVADRRERLRAEADAYETLLATRDEPWDRWAPRYEDYRLDFPTSRHLGDLALVAEAKQAEGRRLRDAEEELLAIHRNAAGRTDSEVLGRLLALKQRLGDGSPLDATLRTALASAARRRADAVERDLAAAEADADRAVARGDVGAALRRLASFGASHPNLTPEEEARLAARRATVLDAGARLATGALERAAAVADPDAKRTVLLAALQGLGGTPETERLRSALLAVAGGGALPPASAAPPAGGGTPGPAPAAPTPAAPPGVVAALAARATEAETAARERRWAAAAEAYRALAAEAAAPAGRRQGWADRADELARAAHLVDDLAAAVASAPARVKLDAGAFELLAADAAGIRLRRGETETPLGWAALSPGDVMALLGLGKETPDRHLALAIVAADLADRPAAMRHLLPLADLPTHRDLAFRVLAQRLDGRTSVPDGGYLPFQGELLDRAEHGRRSEAKHLAELREEAKRLVDAVAKDPGFKALEKLRARRDELDRRRAYALLAIFNETHWPYPHDDPATARAYEVVTDEVTRRWKAVEDVWGEPLKVAAPKGEALEKAVARHAAIVRELQEKGQETTALAAGMAPYAPYVGAGTLTVRSYFRTAAEKDLLEYNRWVMEVYNPSRTTVATDAEREQVRITNEYRTMMGWAFRVAPGPDPYASIEGKNVAAVLDKAKETSRTPLRAVRTDDRLVASARAHSRDMATRGYFSHFAPPNPATGQGQTSPFERMEAAGYKGQGMSENIAMARGPLEAHLMWLRSSGHHRNIVSDWEDLGAGTAGPWTQNFGSGGGAATAVPGKEPPDVHGPAATEEPAPAEGEGGG